MPSQAKARIPGPFADRMRGSLSGASAWSIAMFSACLFLTGCTRGTLSRVSFAPPSQSVETYDYIELTAAISWPHVANPFIDATFTGWFESAETGRRWQVEGFCDSEDGSIFRIRFMPPAAGDYRYFVQYRQNGVNKSSTGTFHAIDRHRRGPIRVDREFPWHFVWEGTGEHYFFNGTTAYWIMGWADEKVIQDSIERLSQLKVNRIRITVAGRTSRLFGEPVMTGANWTTFLTPWPAEFADDIYHPGFDYTRFHPPYWQKFERTLRFARDKDIVISLVLDMNDSRVHPVAESEDERRFFRYAVDRFGAFSNITWDLGDDLDLYRSDSWTRRTGQSIEQWDPYRHLATSHPVDNIHQDRNSSWFGFTSFQDWSRTQHAFMLRERKRQERLGRIIPQTNEEYGYEDHYPLWSKGLGTESADTLRRTAWEIVMAGGYQTTGETARRGTNVLPDTGGGWMNGRGDDTMTMLRGYAHMVDFFTSFEWWKAEPHDELVNSPDYCLAIPGKLYATYLPKGGRITVHLQGGPYSGTWFNPSTGASIVLGPVEGPVWTSPTAPDSNDWALLLKGN
jgi:Protein of unknown function (DUF4038)/Domain of unknown function (DUF5060)/Putative collagen-binding domain of a collagenase